MHSLLKYKGANRRMTLPKRCCVIRFELLAKLSNLFLALGESSTARSFSFKLSLAKAADTSSSEASFAFWQRPLIGNWLNCSTKLTGTS